MRRLSRSLVFPIVICATAWGGAVLWFTLPVGPNLRDGLTAGYAILGVGGLAIGLYLRQFAVALIPFAVASTAMLVWWSMLEPQNDRQWQPDVAELPSAEIDGTRVTLRNVRSFDYRNEKDFTPRWYDKTVDLRDLDTLDLIAVYWMGDAIAHTMLSFGFGGDYVTLSIETRKEEGEDFSAMAGFFRRYELYYVVADESDIIGVRTTHRNPPEDVYLYRTTAKPENIQRLFLAYVSQINRLNEAPEFYNTATTNCTTNISMHVESFQADFPSSWKILASGYFPEFVYEYGRLDQSLPFEDLRQRSLINGAARAADGGPGFSTRIRAGLPGMPISE